MKEIINEVKALKGKKLTQRGFDAIALGTIIWLLVTILVMIAPVSFDKLIQEQYENPSKEIAEQNEVATDYNIGE